MSIAQLVTPIGPGSSIAGIITLGLVSGSGPAAPTDILLSNSSCYTTEGVNAFVGTLSSVDVDPGDTFTYTLVAGAGSTNNASFNISGANLRCNDPSVLGAGTYSVRIRTTDSFSLTFEKPFTITVLTPGTGGNTGFKQSLKGSLKTSLKTSLKG